MPEDVGAAEFDVAAWTDELLTLNPWARGIEIDIYNMEFEASRQKATLVRHAEGREAWNGWANRMLELKAALERAGQWAPGLATRGFAFEDVLHHPRQGKNEATQVWLALASAVFSDRNLEYRFEERVSFYSFLFLEGARFKGATFSGNADFRDAKFSGDADFGYAKFSSDADFGGGFGGRGGAATFGGEANFRDATFSGGAYFGDAFGGATFSGYAYFSATFRGNHTYFSRVAFSGDFTLFGGAAFSGEANFERATFSSLCDIERVRFNGEANFKNARFKEPVSFTKSRFRQAASFDGVDSTSGFSLANASFKQVPGFIGATFKGTLRLDKSRRLDTAGRLATRATRTRLPASASSGGRQRRRRTVSANSSSLPRNSGPDVTTPSGCRRGCRNSGAGASGLDWGSARFPTSGAACGGHEPDHGKRGIWLRF
jgi:hypothetical protein